MEESPHFRVTLHRRHQSLVGALNKLLEYGVLSAADYERCKAIADDLYKHWRAEMKERMAGNAKKRGRPKDTMPQFERCQYVMGCSKRPRPGFKYCEKAHAPYGSYGLDQLKDTWKGDADESSDE